MTASVAAAPDEALRRARDFVENTDVSIFLTGKAGTGKTTFLRDVVRTTAKSCIVVAPTGVAAINAGGVTIHSFFQLATAPFVPGMHTEDRRFSFAKSKLRLIRSLDLLIIDEISMVRADLLDAVDDALRRYRRDSRPFGGVQLLMIGDLHQLAPVVTPADAAVLNGRYDTPYFFSSHALERISYMTVSLEKVFRQQDESFVTLLNHVRDNAMTLADVATLNSRLNPTFVPADGQGFIRLTTHNHTADAYNERRMASLATPPRTFVAAVKGVFPEGSYPTAAELTLKVGAQVMFNKNDTQGGEYYNGLIGTVESFTDDGVMVRSAEDGRLIRVAPQVWENARYTVNEEKGTVETEVQGTFTQVPLRPAWAITIHKSQGLTFSNVIIDLGRGAFTGGQTYVALSRCRSLPGLTLRSPVTRRDIYVNPVITRFAASFNNPAIIERAMEESRADALIDDAVRLFDKGDTPAAVDAFFEANTLRNVTHIPAVQRLIRRRLGVVDRLRDENQRLNDELEAAREKLRSVADEYVRLGHDVGEADWETDAAIANFDRAIALFPDHFEAHLAKGRLLVERGDTDTAAVHLEAASRIHPDDWRPLAYLGDIDRAISDPARAMARYLAAHDLAPKETRVITRLVSLSEGLGDEESAVRYRALLKGLRRPPKKK